MRAPLFLPNPRTTGSRRTRRATSAAAAWAAPTGRRPRGTTWPGLGAIGSDAKPAASRATSGPSSAASSATPSTAPGTATAAAAPREQADHGAGVAAAWRAAAPPPRAARAQSSASACTSAYRQTSPTARPTPRSTAASTPRNCALRVLAPPTRVDGAPIASSRRATVARSAPAASRTATDGTRAEPVGPRPGDPPVVLQRAHHPRDAEAHLVAGRQLRASAAPARRPSASARPSPTSISSGARSRRPRPAAAPRSACGRRDRRRGGRLVEPERVGGVGRVARARVRPRDAHLPRATSIQLHRELVALADRPRVVAQPLEQRGQREHQGHHAGADADRGHRGDPARGRRSRSAPRAASPPDEACARGRLRRAAQDLHRRPPRGAPCRPRRGGHDDRDDGDQCAEDGVRGRRPADARSATRADWRPGRRPRGMPSAIWPRRRGQRHDRRLRRLQRSDPGRREPQRALDAEGTEPALHVGAPPPASCPPPAAPPARRRRATRGATIPAALESTRRPRADQLQPEKASLGRHRAPIKRHRRGTAGPRGAGAPSGTQVCSLPPCRRRRTMLRKKKMCCVRTDPAHTTCVQEQRNSLISDVL